MEALHKAVSILGSQSALARAIRVKQQNIWSWLHVARKVPAEYCLAIEKATQGKVRREELRPDIFGEEKTSHA